MGEQEKRLHRCCFTGHRPEKLLHDEAFYLEALHRAIHDAIEAGYSTFITGMARGVDIWAAELVLSFRRTNPDIHLICALPHPGFEQRWAMTWQRRYRAILEAADLTRIICPSFSMGSYQVRNEWMVDHSSLVIAVYNGEAGGTRNTLEYAKQQGVNIQYA